MNAAAQFELSLDIQNLRAAYLSGALTVEPVLTIALERIERETRSGIWIHRAARETLLAAAGELRKRDPRDLPLYGIPFAVKDNIDVAGMPTTAACPAFAYTPKESALVVRRLINAGAICIGKTNMDQFAAGLVGTRSPYGECQNAFNPEYISGGSSSGSAVAVALGQISFALGTDTAGSGRVPAAFNNLVGYKPTRGLLSTRGVVPACRSLDCVSVFGLTVSDAVEVVRAAAEFDEASFTPRDARGVFDRATISAPRMRCGIPQRGQIQFFGDNEAERLFDAAVGRIKTCGAEIVEIDFSPFQQAAQLLYNGPWLAERYAALRTFIDTLAHEMFPVTRDILERGCGVSGADVFNGVVRLDAMRTLALREWKKMDLLLLPTAPTIYTIAAVNAEPFELNARLGYYTNFVNLLDCAALALPAGFRGDGLPFGISLVTPALNDAALFELGASYHRALGGNLGATPAPLASIAQTSPVPAAAPFPPPLGEEGLGVSGIRLAVVGAHLRGQPLNHELTKLNARFVESCRTAPVYKLYALATQPPKPGLIQVAAGEGTAIEVEVWELAPAAFGTFVANVPPPMGIGTLKLESGALVKGFLCEPLATHGAQDISSYKGWLNYRSARAQ